jgi:predicted RNA-binding Zn ribbon-like protein
MTAADQSLFDLCGGHAALDFVNSLDHRFGPRQPVERLADYPSLLRLSVATGLLDARRARRLARTAPGAAGRALHAAHELREALAAALYTRVDGHAAPRAALRTIERHLGRATSHRELRWEHGRRGRALSWEWARSAHHAELPVWLLAQSAVELLTSASMNQVRACGADTCRWLFLDTSRNHTRRWCDMKVCGNRMKARRFQARH